MLKKSLRCIDILDLWIFGSCVSPAQAEKDYFKMESGVVQTCFNLAALQLPKIASRRQPFFKRTHKSEFATS
jgi:hypothetical protein